MKEQSKGLMLDSYAADVSRGGETAEKGGLR